MFISFIAPTYNVNRYLDDFFKSFVGIEKNKYEIILINDNGEDPSEYVKKYENDINIRFINLKENVGVDFVRNIGIKEVSEKATHFAFIDPDDVIYDKKFINDVEADKITVFDRASFTQIDTKIQKKGNIYSTHFWGSIWGIVFPSALKNEIKFYYKANSDVLTQRIVLFKYKKITKCSSVVMINRRIRGSSLSNVFVSEEKMTRLISISSRLINEGYKKKFNESQELYWLYFISRKNWEKDAKIRVAKFISEKVKITWYARSFYWVISRFMKLLGFDKKQFSTIKKGAYN